ncbi:MAG: class I SAM-dependent methyltransferase [Actinomycetota bacterium]|nr:class I SAM-dependent methyltransferase [Actinomycetota bacterium]
MDRVDRIVDRLDLAGGKGLEIGALHHPVLTRDRANVSYVDHADTPTLREKYLGHEGVTDLVEVDFVWSGNRLADVTAGAGPFDYVIASHVFEHVPNPVAWLGQLAEVLRAGGILSLAIPDQRFCFDARRRLTDVSEVVDAYLSDRCRPTAGMVFDFYSRITEVDTPGVWARSQALPEPGDDEILRGWEWAQKSAATEDYLDVHCWTFTPETFLQILRTLTVLGLVDFEVVDFQPTIRNELEFYIQLGRLPAALDAAERQRRQRDALGRVTESATATQMVVSPSEARLIEAKRRSLSVARHARTLVEDRLRRG